MQRNTLIWIALATWLVAFILSLVLPYLAEPTGDGFTRGLNRVMVFLGWQALACVPAIAAFVFGSGYQPVGKPLRWLSRIPALIELTLVLLIVVLILASRFSVRPVEPPGDLPPTAATAIEPRPPLAEPVAATPEQAPVQTFNGIYRSGFEASHFYTMDGQGPWWLEAAEPQWARIQEFFVDGPGRSGAARVAMTLTGRLEEAGDELDYLGDFEFRLQVESIEAIRGLSEADYEQVLEAISDSF